MINKIYDSNITPVCFFRSTVLPPYMKVMIQITERCNLRCAHCFAEANACGNEMPIEAIRDIIIPQFIENKVLKVTLTGGEPLTHPHAKEIVSSFLDNGIGVSVCTNGTLIDHDWLKELTRYNNIHFNVSLDGLSVKSHGSFRGNMSEAQFSHLIDNISNLGKLGLLNGILTTPNKYASIDEYVDLCEFAKKAGAKYILMNPLSPFGRGTKTQTLAYSENEMIAIKKLTAHMISDSFEIVYIRFPNPDHKPLGECPLGSIPYIFCSGDIAICPYMVFAANASTKYNAENFICGNIFKGANIAKAVKEYKLPSNEICLQQEDCAFCGRGCYAIKISNDQNLLDCDKALCPREAYTYE